MAQASRASERADCELHEDRAIAEAVIAAGNASVRNLTWSTQPAARRLEEEPADGKAPIKDFTQQFLAGEHLRQ